MKTKDKIISAAKTVFHQKGYEGARMQEIADACSINKALLHYHFESKEKLFQAVLLAAVMEMFPAIMTLLNAQKPLLEKIENVVDLYLDFISRNPKMPLFVLNELNQNPDFILNQLQAAGQKPTIFMAQVQEAIAKNEIKSIGPFHIIVDIIALCVFPFIAKPMLQMMSGISDADFKVFIAERKSHITQLLVDGLFIIPQTI